MYDKYKIVMLQIVMTNEYLGYKITILLNKKSLSYEHNFRISYHGSHQ